MRPARTGFCARWRSPVGRDRTSIHSMPTEPEPAPISHSNSPRRGASADRVIARISRLVIWPSCSNQSSGRPGASGMTRAHRHGRDIERHEIERAMPSRSKSLGAVGPHAAPPARPWPRTPSSGFRPKAVADQQLSQFGRGVVRPTTGQNTRLRAAGGRGLSAPASAHAALPEAQSCSRPAEPAGRQAECGNAGQAAPSPPAGLQPRAASRRHKRTDHRSRRTQTGDAAPGQDRREAVSSGDGHSRISPVTSSGDQLRDGVGRRRPARLARSGCEQRRKGRPSPSSPIPMIDSQRPGAFNGALTERVLSRRHATSDTGRHDRGERAGRAVVGWADLDPILSLAGRTQNSGRTADPVPQRRVRRRAEG